MKSEKDQRNILAIKKIPSVCVLIFPLVRCYDFGISRLLMAINSEVNKSLRIHFL